MGRQSRHIELDGGDAVVLVAAQTMLSWGIQVHQRGLQPTDRTAARFDSYTSNAAPGPF